MTRRDATDVLDTETGQVRVLSSRCKTCIFRPEGRRAFGPDRVDDVIAANIANDALLTCHSTLPYGDHPGFGPAVCAGFWARHGMATVAGRIAQHMLGLKRIKPPGEREGKP